MYDDLFYVGSQWKHRERGLYVTITSVVGDGQYTLGHCRPPGTPIDVAITTEELFGTRNALFGTWTAEVLVRDFEAVDLLKKDRYDHILEIDDV